MTHFTVCVVTKDGDYGKALAPFSESLEVDSYIVKTRQELIDAARKEHQAYLDGTLTYPKNLFEEEYGDTDFTNDDAIIARIKEYNEDDMIFDEDDNEISRYNENAKWDWYQLGGRWAGSLRLKDGVQKEKDSEVSFFNFDLLDDQHTDFAQVKDIDFSPEQDKIDYFNRFWEINVDGAEATEDEQKEYEGFYKPEYYIEHYGDKESFVKAQTTFYTCALLYNGEWIEPGQYGWFGSCTAKKEDYAKYRQLLQDTINNLDQNDYIAVVDCHI